MPSQNLILEKELTVSKLVSHSSVQIYGWFSIAMLLKSEYGSLILLSITNQNGIPLQEALSALSKTHASFLKHECVEYPDLEEVANLYREWKVITT